MRYGIFSDIHGNLEAMEAVIYAFEKEVIDRYCCVGDIVGYSANPHECIEIVKNLKAACVAGNHDWAVVDKTDIRYFNPMAKEAIYWTRLHASREDMAFLDGLGLIFKSEEFILAHGTLQEPSFFYYLTDEMQAGAMFRLMDRNVAFVGHSHIPGIFIQIQNHVECLPAFDVQLAQGCKYIVNTGSVGQPRDGNPMATYCIFDTAAGTISIKRVNYDIESAQKKILKMHLPPFLASRLAVGR